MEPLNVTAHADALFAALSEDPSGRLWTYMPYGPFTTLVEYRGFLERECLKEDPFFYAIVDYHTQQAVGVASYLRIVRTVGVIEVGHIMYSPRLQRRPSATETMYLLMRNAFEELGFRRYEWKCDALNAPSRTAAERLGFRFEGIFRQATIYKNRNRDTAWYSIIDGEWPTIKVAFEKWLAPSNFDGQGNQRTRLADFAREVVNRKE